MTDSSQTSQPLGSPASQPRKRRRAIYVSEADRRLLASGKSPSWQQTAWLVEPVAEKLEEIEQSSEQQLLDNVPPHWGETRL